MPSRLPLNVQDPQPIQEVPDVQAVHNLPSDDLEEVARVLYDSRVRTPEPQSVHIDVDSPGTSQDVEVGSHLTKKKWVWHSGADLVLLRETMSVFPYDKPRKGKQDAWEQIAMAVNTAFPTASNQNKVVVRSCRDRIDYLVDAWKENDHKALKSSGTEEAYEEKEQLCEEISEQRLLAEELTASAKRRKVTDREEAERTRTSLLAGMTSADDTADETPGGFQKARRRRVRRNDKMEEFMERRIDLAEKMFSADMEDRERRRDEEERGKEELRARDKRDAQMLEIMSKILDRI